MYKIEEIFTLVNKIENPTELPKNLIEFANNIQIVEKELKKVNPKYDIELTSYEKDEVLDSQYIKVTLNYENKELFKYGTNQKFYKFQELVEYEIEDSSIVRYSDHGGFTLTNTIGFKEDSELFKKIIEDQIIKNVLKNEKQLKNVIPTKKSLQSKCKY